MLLITDLIVYQLLQLLFHRLLLLLLCNPLEKILKARLLKDPNQISALNLFSATPSV